MKKISRFLAITPHQVEIICLLGLYVLLTPAPLMATDLYGLVIGINTYKNVGTLDGAVNDAQDIADALKQAGAKQVVLLKDGEAERSTILAKWQSLTNQAKNDDILVFSYAGHGSQEKEHIANSEADGLDENFILANFDVHDQGSAQRIVDDEMDALFKETPQLKILFIADSCHSGTMTRPFVKKLKKRAVSVLEIKNDALTVLYGAKSRSENKINPTVGKSGGSDIELASNVFGFSGVPDDEEVVEIMAPDTKQPRGALSLAFGKALRGAADTNANGEISKEELEHFIKENVRMDTEGLQTAQIFGGNGFSIPIHAQPSIQSKEKKQPIDFTVFVTNVPNTVTKSQWHPLLGTAKAADSNQTANAIWNIGEEKIFSQLGDTIYDGRQPIIQQTRAFSRAKNKTSSAGGVEISYATKVFDKLITVEHIKKRSEAISPTMVLKPDNKLQRAGNEVTLEMSDQQYPYLTLFNIASDGTINNLYPLQDGKMNDPLEVPLNQTYPLTFNVEPPYGGDHFVVIFSEKPLTGLHKDLQGMNGNQNVKQIEVALDRHLQGVKHQIGIHGVFTGP